MDPSRAAFEAFDGVEIELVGGRVVRAPAFSTKEAVGCIRKLYRLGELEAAFQEGDLGTIGGLLRTRDELSADLLGRLGLSGERVTSIGFAYESPTGEAIEWGDLTVDDLRAMARIILDAGVAEDEGDQALAQIRWLDEAPGVFGIDGSTVSPADLLAWGFRFQEAFYLHLYGLASDFYSRLHRAPAVKAWKIRGPKKPETSALGAAG